MKTILEDFGGYAKMNVVFENNNIDIVYDDGETYRVLSNIPTSVKGRESLLEKIETKVVENNIKSKIPFEKQCEDFYSLLNRYQRQWDYLLKLMDKKLPYNFGDLLA